MSAEFNHKQQSFVDYVRGRTPQCDNPLVTAQRAAVYKRLVSKILYGSLENAFPIAKKSLGQNEWQNLISQFVAEHRFSHPEIWRMPSELSTWLAGKTTWQERYPYLLDLLSFEWIEIEVFMMEDRAPQVIETAQGSLSVNREYVYAAFQYPVYRIPAEELMRSAPAAAQGTIDRYWLLAYRHPQTRSVHFVELSQDYLNIFIEIAEKGTEFYQAFDKYSPSGVINKQAEQLLLAEGFLRFLEAKQLISH